MRVFLLLTLLIIIAIHSLLYCADSLFSSYGHAPYDGLLKNLRNTNNDNFLADKSVSVSPMTSFAVVINTYKRPEMLRLALNHYAKKCGKEFGVSQVFVVWAEVDVEPPIFDDAVTDSNEKSGIASLLRPNRMRRNFSNDESNWAPVTFIRVAKDSLNSRFLPIEGLESDALFMVDDDVQVQCSSLSSGFDAWKHNSKSLVGFYPRIASRPLFGNGNDESKFIYHTWPIVYALDTFNIILTKASFFHKKYLEMYFDPKQQPTEVLDYVDEHKNCEDIAMAYLVAKETKPSNRDEGHCQNCPVYVEGEITDLGLTNGISTESSRMSLSGHMAKRSNCISAIGAMYKKHNWRYPLVDVGLRDQSWRHHFPGFWWQTRPSNIFEWFSVGNSLS